MKLFSILAMTAAMVFSKEEASEEALQLEEVTNLMDELDQAVFENIEAEFGATMAAKKAAKKKSADKVTKKKFDVKHAKKKLSERAKKRLKIFLARKKAQFKRWDTNHDGKIYFPEFWKGMKHYTFRTTKLKVPDTWKKNYKKVFLNITEGKDYYTWPMLKKRLTE